MQEGNGFDLSVVNFNFKLYVYFKAEGKGALE